jgi:hypothetical protein
MTVRKALTDLLPDTQYAIRMRAVNEAGVSEWSTRYVFTTIADDVLPDPPTNVTWVTVGDTFHGEWTKVTTNEEGDTIPITRYEVELVADSTTKYRSVLQVGAGTQKVTFDLPFEENRALFGTPQPSITMRVRAVDNKELKSVWANGGTAVNAAPNPPTSVVATAGLNSIGLTWVKSTSTDVIGYNVYVSSGGALIGFTAGTTFTYHTATYTPTTLHVTAVDKFSQESSPRTAANTVTPTSPFITDTTPPPLPAFDTGASNITVNTNGIGAKANLAWTIASPPSDLAGFYVRYRRTGDTNWTVATFHKDDLAGQIELQLAYQSYDFQIKSFDWSNNESAWSATMAKAPAANTAPGQVTGVDAEEAPQAIRYTWTANTEPDLRHYEVTFSPNATFGDSDDITFFTGTANYLTVSGLVPSTTYRMRVRAIDTQGGVNGTGAWSATFTTATTAYIPTPLTDGNVPGSSPAATVTGGLGYLYVRWPAVANADPVTYEVHLSTTSGFTPNAGTKATEVAGLAAIIDVLPGTNTKLTYGTTYYVKILAKDADGPASSAGTQGSGSPSKVASGDVISIGADLIVPGTGIINNLIINTGGGLQSANYSANTAGYRLSTSGLEVNNGSIRASTLIGDTIGSSTGIINIALGAALVLNGGYIKSNTATGTTLAAAEAAGAGFFLSDDGLFIGGGANGGRIKANALISDTLTSTTITMGTGAVIQTSGYNGTSGFKLSAASGLEIPDGSIAATKVIVGSGRNLLTPGYADFEYYPNWFTNDNGSNNNMATNVNASLTIVNNASAYNNSQFVRHVRVGTGTNSDVYFGPTTTSYPHICDSNKS